MTSSAPPLPESLVASVRIVFGEWTAVSLAIENEWGGGGTREKALALLDRTLHALNTPVVHRDELEVFLDGALVDDFNVEAEDESPRQVAELLCLLHSEARAGVTTTADALAQRAAARGAKTWVDAPVQTRRRADDESSDDGTDDEGEEGDAMDMGGGGGGSSSGEGGKRQEPIVDDDGFQMVTRSGRGRRG